MQPGCSGCGVRRLRAPPHLKQRRQLLFVLLGRVSTRKRTKERSGIPRKSDCPPTSEGMGPPWSIPRTKASAISAFAGNHRENATSPIHTGGGRFQAGTLSANIPRRLNWFAIASAAPLAPVDDRTSNRVSRFGRFEHQLMYGGFDPLARA